MMMVGVYPEELRGKLINKLRSKRTDLGAVISVLEKPFLPKSLWVSLCNYTEELEKKYSVSEGFKFLLKKYLADY
jgi:hypothetical protein